MLKHTPGPWTITGPNDKLNQIGIGRRLPRKGIDPIGCVYGSLRCEETHANAKLFAAAPTMYELLNGAIEEFGTAIDEDEPINGADAVDWLVDFVTRARRVLDE